MSAAPQEDALSLAETQPAGNVGRMKILIIEDDLEAAVYLTKAFREAGIVADHASDGESGLFMGSENTYDVIVIDRMLPRRDGLSVISELRRKAHPYAGPHPLRARPGR